MVAQWSWILQCCQRGNHETGAAVDLGVLTSEASDTAAHMLLSDITRVDSFDVTFAPRNGVSTGANASSPNSSVAMTPRQRHLSEIIELPMLNTYPIPPGMAADQPEEDRRRILLQTYRDFVLEMHTGMYLTQLTSNRDYSNIHCQLMEDLQTLKLDQSNGRIIEFPLTGVSKVYRIVKNDERYNGSLTPSPGSSVEHIVVVEFMRRKLAFVFHEVQASQRFLVCMELLIRDAQQKKAGKTFKSLVPPPASRSPRPDNCTTPRQVRDFESRDISGSAQPAQSGSSGIQQND